MNLDWDIAFCVGAFWVFRNVVVCVVVGGFVRVKVWLWGWLVGYKMVRGEGVKGFNFQIVNHNSALMRCKQLRFKGMITCHLTKYSFSII